MKPVGSLMGNLAKMSFKSLGRKLPDDWQQPSGDAGKQYSDAFQPSDRTAVSDPMRIFQPASTNKLHVDTAKKIGKNIEDYMDGVCKAIASGWGNWMSACMVSGAIVAGPVGTVTPGMVQGPPMSGLILASGPPMSSPQEMKFTNAIASAIGTAWQTWHMGLAGTLQYPAFAAFPGPMAPPMPNIPIPVAAFASPGEAMLGKSTLSGLMMANYGSPTDNHAKDIFDSVSDAFNQTFTTWKPATMVNNVLGQGPIPTFVPPWVPVGPVLGGVAMGAACLV